MHHDRAREDRGAVQGCTRGGADWWVLGGCYTGTHPPAIPGPIFDHIPALGPTHGQMKAIFSILMRFPRYGLEMTRIDPRIDPRTDPPDRVPRCPRLVPDDPQMTILTSVETSYSE